MSASNTPDVSARVEGDHAKRFYDAAAQFVALVLRQNNSLFTPGRHIWTIDNLSQLHRHFVEEPDTSQASFIAKFKRQLTGVAPDIYQLAGELMYVHLLPAARNSISGPTKRTLINTILSWSPSPVSIPEDLDRALDDGIATMGVAFGTYRPFQLAFLLEFVLRWKELSPVEQQQLLAVPWAFKQMLFTPPIRAAYAQREAILHIVHPDSFEGIVSRDHKQRIARAFADLVTPPTDDIDQQLQQIRQRLTQPGQYFNFYQPNVRRIWLGEYESAPESEPVLEARPHAAAQLKTNHVFICYSRQDEEFALSLAARLQEGGTAVWMDRLNIEPGVDWDLAIDEALYDCETLLIILSPASVKSYEVRSELRLALNERKRIVPVLYQTCRMPRHLLNLQYADFRAHGADDAVALRDLAWALRSKIRKPDDSMEGL